MEYEVEVLLEPEDDAFSHAPERGHLLAVRFGDRRIDRAQEGHTENPQPLEHLADTPPELRDRIDQLVATMVDLDLTKEAASAQHELVDIGKPALPILLTGLFETPLDSEENAIRCNLVVQTLRRITGHSFGYSPQLLEGSSVGTTEERRRSGIRQWFAWWHRNQDEFEEKEVEDGLEGLIELTEEEKRWLERNQD